MSVKQELENGLEPVILLHETKADQLKDELISWLDYEPKIYD